MARSFDALRMAFIGLIRDELDRAYAKHGRRQWGRHEFYGILKEEFRELEDAIFDDEPMERVVAEMVQVAAMCVRYYETGDAYGYVGKTEPAPTTKPNGEPWEFHGPTE